MSSEVYYFINNFSSQNIKVIINKISNIDTNYINISKDLFKRCIGCRQERKMASVPQGMFAARKVRENMNNTWERSLFESRQEQRQPLPEPQEKSGPWNKPGIGRDWATTHFPKLTQQLMDHPPAKYNSKLMNSIWGLYNRYSVHNFKKITGDVAICFGQQQPELLIQPGYPCVAVSFSSVLSGSAGVGGGNNISSSQMGSKPTPNTWEKIVLGADY